MEFDFEGFTTIVGRNYIGKSATLRAINAALINQQGTNFIRWGSKFCEVRIKTEDIEILWHKEKGNNFYKINNGDPYTSVGNLPPPKPILDAGFGTLTVAKEKVNLFYAEQFHPLFLIDKKDSKSADLLISIYGLDKLYKAIDLCAKDQRKNSDTLKIRKIDLEQAEKGLDRFKDFDKVKEALTSVEAQKISVSKKQNDITQLNTWVDRVETISSDIDRLKSVRSVVLPSYDKIDKIISEQTSIKKYLNEVSLLKDSVINLRKVKEVVLPEDKELDVKIKDLAKLNQYQNRFLTLNKSVKLLEKSKDITIPEISDKKLKDIEDLKAVYNRLAVLATEVKNLRGNVISTNKDLEKVNKDLESYDICPACGKNLK